MKRETITLMLNSLDDEYISEAAFFYPEPIQEGPERIVYMKKKRIITFALAATLLLALGAAAYAVDLFGIRAMFMKDNAPADNPDGGYVSLTQPQDVPEEMDESIRAKIENSTKAWAEWVEWSRENGICCPESCMPPENCSSSEYVENADGTWTAIFYDRYEPAVDETGKVIFDKDGTVVIGETHEIERRIISTEDYEQMLVWSEVYAKGFSGYDYNYEVYSQEMADKLESIAANYELKLRHQREAMYENINGITGFSSHAEITAKINEVCSGGKSFFLTEPTGYDKFYYFDEGTFAVSFFTTENLTNTGTSCYLYNSPYGTLSSGFEIFDVVQDVSAFTTRYHTAPDGTNLTVLQNGKDMYAYVYLENSFVTLHITQLEGLSDAEIDAVLDMVNYSAIR